jgi:hypothetical protein
MCLGIDTGLLGDGDFARHSEGSVLIKDSDLRVLSIDFSRD